MLSTSQNGDSWFGLDNNTRSVIRNGEAAFKTGENMSDTVQQSVAQKFDSQIKWQNLHFLLNFTKVAVIKLNKIYQKYCHMGLKMQLTFCIYKACVFMRGLS